MKILQYMCIFTSLSATEVYSVDFTISKDKMLIGSAGVLTFTCNITEKDVETVYLIQIRRSIKISGIDHLEWETLALMETLKSESPTLSSDVIASAKDYVAGGVWNSTVPSDTYLTLSMNVSKIECADSREYKCELAYKSNITSAVKSYEMNRTFSVFVTPRVISLIGSKNGGVVQGPSLSDMAVVDIGDELDLSCTANIGSFPETTIHWYKTSASIDEFVEYQPGFGTFDEGSANSDHECGYIRTGHVNYNITNSDAERANGLAFECYITVNEDPYGSLTTQANPRFYLYIVGKTTQPITSTSAENLTVTTDKTTQLISSTSAENLTVTTDKTTQRISSMSAENLTVIADKTTQLISSTSAENLTVIVDQTTQSITSTSVEHLTVTTGNKYKATLTSSTERPTVITGGNVISENENTERKMQLETIFGPTIAAFVAGVAVTLVILRRKYILKIVDHIMRVLK